MIDVRLGQDIFDLSIQAFGRIDDIGSFLVAANAFEVSPGQSFDIKTENVGDERIKVRFAATDFRPVNSTFGILDFSTLGIPIMIIGSTFIVT
jgi:hypothetical protein